MGGAAAQEEHRPRVSVVVAVRNNPGALGGLLRALAAQDVVGGVEVVVADNHDRPRVTVSPPEGLAVRVVHEPVAGLSRARNRAIAAARGAFIAVTDPDARPHPRWLSALVQALQDSGAWCAGGRVICCFTGAHPRHLEPALMAMFAPPFWPEQVEELRAPWWIVGCNMAFRAAPRPRFCEALGVRGSRHLACEDLEITVRAQQQHLGVIVVPDALVRRAVHPADVGLGALMHRAFWHGASIARLRALHPSVEIYDSYRLGEVVRALRGGVRPALVALARITGYRTCPSTIQGDC